VELLKYPDPRLVAKNLPIEKLGPEEIRKIEQMFHVMAASDGIGLAAPQVGWNVQLFILGFSQQALVFWNPTIELSGERVTMMEGCLSFPGIPGQVERSTRARLKAMTVGGPVDIMATDFLAQAVQHEMDHVDGVLFIERLSAVERTRIEPQLEELRAKKN
jgi:peptide deformylase